MVINDLLRRHEGKTLEFKRHLSSPENVLRTLVAFANTAGGVVILGIEDRTKNVRGVASPLDIEERLINLVSDSVIPRLLPDVEILPWRGKQVVAVEVYPSASRPHHIRAEGADQGVYVRIGSSNRRADSELIGEMRRAARGESYDEQAMPDLEPLSIDSRAASKMFSPVRKLKQRDLETLRIVTTYRARKVPTVGGMLLFGTRRLEHFPDAWIQAGRFAGTDKAEILDSEEIRDYLPEAVEVALRFIQRHNSAGMEIGPVRRRQRWTLPPIALREAAINAIAHADYSQRGAPIRISIFDNRLEVENPGLLPFGLTVEDLGRGVSKLRNRVIGRVFQELKLVEQWGGGIQRMMAACRSAGLPSPEFEELGHRFRVTFHTSRAAEPEVDEIDRNILDALRRHAGGLSPHDIAEQIGLTPRATRTRLSRLTELGLVRAVGSSAKDPKRRYFLSSSEQ